MQKINVTQHPILSNISVRGRGYLEAIQKIINGQSMVDAGLLELAQLDGKTSKDVKSASGDGGVDVTKKVQQYAQKSYSAENLKNLLKSGPLGTKDLAAKVGANPNTVRSVLAKTNGVKRVGKGSETKWVLRAVAKKIARKKAVAAKNLKTDPASSKAPSLEVQEEDNKLVLDYVIKHPKSSVGAVMKGVKRSFYPTKRALLLLTKAKKIQSSIIHKETGGTVCVWEPVSEG